MAQTSWLLCPDSPQAACCCSRCCVLALCARQWCTALSCIGEQLLCWQARLITGQQAGGTSSADAYVVAPHYGAVRATDNRRAQWDHKNRPAVRGSQSVECYCGGTQHQPSLCLPGRLRLSAGQHCQTAAPIKAVAAHSPLLPATPLLRCAHTHAPRRDFAAGHHPADRCSKGPCTVSGCTYDKSPPPPVVKRSLPSRQCRRARRSLAAAGAVSQHTHDRHTHSQAGTWT